MALAFNLYNQKTFDQLKLNGGKLRDNIGMNERIEW